jgi:peptidoglycan hydrolase CwlO-like protein
METTNLQALANAIQGLVRQVDNLNGQMKDLQNRVTKYEHDSEIMAGDVAMLKKRDHN